MTDPGDAEPHLSTGARALHALEPDELMRFDAHLADCPSCTEEVRGLRAAAAALGASADRRPPAELRERVLAEARDTPQLPPERPRRAAPSHRGSGTRWRGPRLWLPLAAAAVLIAATVATVVLAGGDRREPTAGEQMQQCVVDDPDAAMMQPTVGDAGSVARSDTCNAVLIRVPDLPAPPEGMGYQLWMMDTGTPRSMGMVRQDVVPMPMHAGDRAVAVTVEPMTGSAEPSGDPVWLVPLH